MVLVSDDKLDPVTYEFGDCGCVLSLLAQPGKSPKVSKRRDGSNGLCYAKNLQNPFLFLKKLDYY